MQYEKRKLSFDVAKVRRISAESNDLAKILFELLRRYGE